ncbi:Glutamine-dependent NAD(+) synthetase [Candidatus Terasakiella magnetica]|uniref:Glutamine-dependent NAD(+) synthetase n=1 Tax=Candidatus Terasakiella magnetica TaxID=1867952 RepID=A0A1C3RKE5_9PROT|nr:NAD+ synthase [Candidatus Terasakiella magnetica]SCA57784.1 Glutamine-dependent NAD(+) synthetase [Candidatus Terasakiella magnetica]
MTASLTLALAQLNPTVGAIHHNMSLLKTAFDKAVDQKADLLVTSELLSTGYPPEDLVLKPAFQDEVETAVNGFIESTKGCDTAVLLGTPWRIEGKLYNSALMIVDGEITDVVTKRHLPNYGVFDEIRFFEEGRDSRIINFKGHKLGAMICEDMWFEDVTADLKYQGAEMLLVLNGSPFEADKPSLRYDLAKMRTQEAGVPLVYVNQVGGQDELVFDGASFVMCPEGERVCLMKHWDEELSLVTLTNDGIIQGPQDEDSEGLEAIYQAMVLGLRDYVNKNGFPGVVLGLSGGIDSAISAAVAVDALGADRVKCVMMPSPYTSQESLEDAKGCAQYLGVEYDSVSIEPVMQAYDTMLSPLFEGRDKDITEENIQSRARGLLLMALSNKFGHMLLTTGNKSEMSVGYATIYGDMCGGYSVLKDVYKMTVFALCKWRNDHKPAGCLGPAGRVMPDNVISKPPSAELRPDQKDEDSLPPYEILDDILECLIEKEYSLEDVVACGHDADVVRRIWKLLDRAEYKRRQAPPGVKVTSRAFGRDRRYPLTNGFTSLI